MSTNICNSRRSKSQRLAISMNIRKRQMVKARTAARCVAYRSLSGNSACYSSVAEN